MARDFEDHSWKDVVPPEDLVTYKTFRRELRLGRRPALLAIDLYNVVYRGGPKLPHEICDEFPMTCGKYAWDAIEPTKKLFAACRAAGLPVIYTTAARSKSKLNATARNTAAHQGLPDDFAIYEAFPPQGGDYVVLKERASGFYGTALSAYLVQQGCDSVIVCGESTSGCVRASVVDAYSNGFHPVVVEECVYDRALLTHKVNLFDMHHKYADVMTLEEVTAQLATLGRRPAAAE